VKYSFACPANDGYVTTVEASNDEEAVAKIMVASAEHASAHPGMVMTMDEVKAMVMAGLKKG
jgi:hypothetical protein